MDTLPNGPKQLLDTPSGLEDILDQVAADVTTYLSCVGAAVLTLEQGGELDLRAYASRFPPSVEERIRVTLPRSLQVQPERLSLHKQEHQHNLIVQSLQQLTARGSRGPLTSSRLQAILDPLMADEDVDLLQEITQVRQVACIPCQSGQAAVGVLVALTRFDFSPRDLEFFSAIASQTAIAIQNQRRLAESQALAEVNVSLQTSIEDETHILQTITDTVVKRLGYAGALVSTLESGGRLQVRTYTVDLPPSVLHKLEELLRQPLEEEGSTFHIDNIRHSPNLSVRAFRSDKSFLLSERLFDLFRPLVSQQLSAAAQRVSGVRQLIAIPLRLEGETIGTLFVGSRTPQFTSWEIDLLLSLGQQAAVGIRNARLFRLAEEQREIAQVFARMAFSAATTIHELRNHISGFNTFLSLVEATGHQSIRKRGPVLKTIPNIREQLSDAIELLDSLHEPWRTQPDSNTALNHCLLLALQKQFGLLLGSDTPLQNSTTVDQLTLGWDLTPDLPELHTSPGMLTEAIRILLKNGAEAIAEKYSDAPGGQLTVWSGRLEEGVLFVAVEDNGIGIPNAHQQAIFELGWSSKEGRGMGFGLFWLHDFITGLGGMVRVESEPQVGSRFELHLPLPKPIEIEEIS